MSGKFEKLRYINHLGEELAFGREGLYVNENELHNFSWDVVKVNNRISGFERGMQTRAIPVRVMCSSREDGIIKRNQLFEIPEKDVLARNHGNPVYGKLIINGYYCECYVTDSQKSRYTGLDNFMESEITITTDRPYWVKEEQLDINRDNSFDPYAGTLDFPFDFPFDLPLVVRRRVTRTNPGFYSSNFRMEIHGQAVNPTVDVNGHEYQVNAIVRNGETLIIDSISKTITLVNDKTQERTNAFDARSRDSYIFEPLPSGQLEIVWNNSFNMEMYLLEERSEPKWSIKHDNFKR